VISIIISSVDKQLLKDVKLNIEETIGVPFEVISFDNSDGKMGLCEIYNKGSRLAKFDFICYMHEDIELKTEGWGQRVLNIFTDNVDLGLLGIAGSTYKSIAPSGWGTAPDIDVHYINVLQSFKYSNKPPQLMYMNPRNEKLTLVACVDGVWFCTKKKYALHFPFDEDLLKGFHCYDLDFSFSIGQKYKVAVTYEIMIEHFSEGNIDNNWLNETLKLHQKWKNNLPINIANLSIEQSKSVENEVFYQIIDKMTKYKFKTKSKLAFLNSYDLIQIVGLRRAFKLYLYTLFKTFP